MNERHSKRGFTLIEMVVVVSIIAAMAAILVPVISDELVATETSHAMGDCQRIAAGLTQYIKDTRMMPTGPSGDNTVHFLYGNGTIPATNPFGGAGAVSVALSDFLTDLTNGPANGGAKWNGPYLQQVPEDPWGQAYVVNVNGYYSGKENVWVVSAGPNGEVDTTVSANELGGDDIGILID